MKICFLVPGGGGGGAHSVVQEALGLSRLGLGVSLAIAAEALPSFKLHYPELDGSRVAVGGHSGAAQLAELIQGRDLAIATGALSVHELKAALDSFESEPPSAGYYIQDYEPLFYSPDSAEWSKARASYTILPGALLFAKTDWLRRAVSVNHDVSVAKVAPSLDRGLYYPELRGGRSRLVISAMLRPRTPRRAPRRTLRILERLSQVYGDRVHLLAFGASDDELTAHGLSPSPYIDYRGVLTREEVAAVLRSSDLFLDLSDYQAFGRTALEGMACGCVPVVPALGGADEFARHLENALVVDTRSDHAIWDAVSLFIDGTDAERTQLRRAALDTALRFSVDGAALSEQRLFAAFLGSALR